MDVIPYVKTINDLRDKLAQKMIEIGILERRLDEMKKDRQELYRLWEISKKNNNIKND